MVKTRPPFLYIAVIVFFLIVVSFFTFKSCQKIDDRRIPPQPHGGDMLPSKIPLLNVYLENSGSMNGYVQGITELERDLKSYLYSVNRMELTDSMSLNYINDRIIFQGSDVNTFISDLEPRSFIKQGGNTATTDIAGVLKMVLENTNKNSVSLFVSDCIISPGKKIQVSQLDEYLKDQQIEIENDFSTLAKRSDIDLGVIVYQLQSMFQGNYYNRVDERKYISDTRPYYLWLIGDRNYLKLLTDKIDINKIEGSAGNAKVFSVFNISNSPKFQILNAPRRGSFDRSRNAPNHIYNIKKETKGGQNSFMFSIGINFSLYLLDDNYLLDSKNYKISNPDYNLKIDKVVNEGGNFRMQLQTNTISQSNLSIDLLKKKPHWIEEANDDVGLDIYAPDAMSQTYGLKYILDGVYDAFSGRGANDTYSTIELKIN